MARVTVEDCIDKVENRFELVLIASHRARMIAAGAPITVDRDNDKNPVVALREIAETSLAPDDLRKISSNPCKTRRGGRTRGRSVPALSCARGRGSRCLGDMQFDRMTEEDLLRGLEGLVPPADTEDDGD